MTADMPVHICDIAHALSRLTRYGGHTKFHTLPYSVAEHCINVARCVLAESKGDPVAALYGLLHDAAEAYLGDVVSPLKQVIGPRYHQPESDVSRHIERCMFNVNFVPPVSAIQKSYTKEADAVVLGMEREALLQFSENDKELWNVSLDGLTPLSQYVDGYRSLHKKQLFFGEDDIGIECCELVDAFSNYMCAYIQLMLRLWLMRKLDGRRASDSLKTLGFTGPADAYRQFQDDLLLHARRGYPAVQGLTQKSLVPCLERCDSVLLQELSLNETYCIAEIDSTFEEFKEASR